MKNTLKMAFLPMWVIDRMKEEMRLSPGTWETITKAVEEAEVPEKTACAVRLPPATTFAAGVSVASVLMAIKQRSRLKPEFLEFTQPAPQPHPDPIAWMVGTAIWWTKEEAERDAAETGLPIVGLGPMTGIAPAERHLGEPVCLDGATFMGEPSFQHSLEWYREGISKHWKKICDLRAEVERLRAALRFYADREHFHFESGNWDTVSGEPLNILWCGEEPDFIEDGTVARNALSASVEPSAPAVSNLPELTDDLREILGRPNFTCHFIAKALRIMGHSIAPKSEDEQAVVIHWLLGHYLKSGSDWRVRAEAELKSASEKLAPSAAPQK